MAGLRYESLCWWEVRSTVREHRRGVVRRPSSTRGRALSRRRNRDREPDALPRPRRRVGGRVDLPGPWAGQVASAHPALRRAFLPLAGVLRRQRDRLLRDPHHGPVPAGAVRLQRRGAAVVLAGELLRLLGPGPRPLPALRPRRRAGLPGAPGRGVPGTAVPGAGAGEVVAAGHPAVPRAVGPRRRR